MSKLLRSLERGLMAVATRDASVNKYNQQFFELGGGVPARYDAKAHSVLQKGYNDNGDTFSIISQIATKFASVPIYHKTVADKKAYQEYMRAETKSLSVKALLRKSLLETKAFKEEEVDNPLPRPTPNMSETEFMVLWETCMLYAGEAFIYVPSPAEGPNAGIPTGKYLLPPHYVDIVLRDVKSLDNFDDNPIKSYIIRIGNRYREFYPHEIIHTKFANPNFDMNGQQLRGFPPLTPVLKNIQTQNITQDNNMKTMKNGGSYGFIHGIVKSGQSALNADQAAAIKKNLVEMQNDDEILGRIRVVGGEFGFTRLNLDTDKLKPFEYLKYDQKAICNALNWSDKLLNNDDGAKYDNMASAWKMAISNRIVPDLKIYQDAMNEQFYPRFAKRDGNIKIISDITELPEMQEDQKKLAEWMEILVRNGAISPEEFRVAMKFPESGNECVKKHYIQSGLVPIDQLEISDNDFDKAEEEFNLNE